MTRKIYWLYIKLLLLLFSVSFVATGIFHSFSMVMLSELFVILFISFCSMHVENKWTTPIVALMTISPFRLLRIPSDHVMLKNVNGIFSNKIKGVRVECCFRYSYYISGMLKIAFVEKSTYDFIKKNSKHLFFDAKPSIHLLIPISDDMEKMKKITNLYWDENSSSNGMPFYVTCPKIASKLKLKY